MVGFDSSSILNAMDHATAGAISGAVTRGLCQPLDVIKIRFQLQVEPVSSKSLDSKYWGVYQTFSCIIKEEGFSALWKGHTPAQLLSVTYGITQFVSFEALTKLAMHQATVTYSEEYKPLVSFVCGSIAGSLATLFSFPADVVRTRLVAQGEPRVYKGVIHSIVTIYTKEGPQAFFKGLNPTLLQIAPHSGAQFAFYTIFTNIWMKFVQIIHETNEGHVNNISMMGSLIAGSFAGFCAKALVYPLDLAKKRLQIQGFQNERHGFGKAFSCNGLIHCFVLIVKEENVRGLFKGLWPSLIKATFSTGLHFCVYEKVCQLIAEDSR